MYKNTKIDENDIMKYKLNRNLNKEHLKGYSFVPEELYSDPNINKSLFEKKEIILNKNNKIIWCTYESFDIYDLFSYENKIDSYNIPHSNPLWLRSSKQTFFEEKIYGNVADWEFFCSILNKGFFGKIIHEPLSRYKVDDNSHNRSDKNNEKNKKKVINKYLLQ